MKRIYIAGPMSGIEHFNYPAFNREAARLRALGFHVENPAEGDECDSWEDYMRQAIAQMLTCETIALLPGWNRSRGACIEHRLARELNMRCLMASELIQRVAA